MKFSKEILKAVFASFGCLVFFSVSIAIAWSAHHYQTINEPMPNGKGGHMSFRDGYHIALICFLISIVFFITAYKSSRIKP
jgi:uncharacterized BrkB/YihY/UPF0761 family membrane protein